MMHTLTLELPDDVYEPLLYQTQRNASTPEALLTQWAIKAVQPVPEDPLLKLLGSVEGDVSDVSAEHDENLHSISCRAAEGLEHYRAIIEAVFNEYAAIPYAHSDLECEAVFDEARNRYLLVTVGWDRERYVHFTLVHIDIADGKLWIHWDRTEDGIATELVAAGVPKEDIVLGFKSEEMRRHTEFAVA